MGNKKYSISELNKHSLNLVCKINNLDEYSKLSMVCPNMVGKYYNDCEYYLTSRWGRGNIKYYGGNNASDGNPYILITLDDINFLVDDMIVYENGIPLVWE